MRIFADSFEVLDSGSNSQRKLGSQLIFYFCGVSIIPVGRNGCSMLLTALVSSARFHESSPSC